MSTEYMFVVGLIIIGGLVAEFIFKKTHFPEVLILILIGVVLGHFGAEDSIDINDPLVIGIITISLIYVIFYGALPIKIKSVVKSMSWAFRSAILHILLITSMVAGISYLLGFTIKEAFALGTLFCVLDGSIINSMLEYIKLSRGAEAFIQLESAITDILVIVVIITALNFTEVSLESIASNIANFLVLSTGLGVLFAILWSFIVKSLKNTKHIPISTMVVLMVIYALAEYVNANGAITVFVFAIVLSNIKSFAGLFYKKDLKLMGDVSRKEKDFFSNITFLIRTLLFVYIGMLVELSQPVYLLIGAGLVFLAFIIRSFIYRFVKVNRSKPKDLLYMEVFNAMGLTPIVLMTLIDGSPRFNNVLVGGIFASVILMSGFTFLIKKGWFISLSDIILFPAKLFFKKKDLSK